MASLPTRYVRYVVLGCGTLPVRLGRNANIEALLRQVAVKHIVIVMLQRHVVRKDNQRAATAETGIVVYRVNQILLVCCRPMCARDKIDCSMQHTGVQETVRHSEHAGCTGISGFPQGRAQSTVMQIDTCCFQRRHSRPA